MNIKAELSLPLSQTKVEWLKAKVRDVPDFPKQGIVFKDLTTLLSDAEAFTFIIEAMSERCHSLKPDFIVGIEARGFIIAAAIAHQLQLGFIPIRKPGKLPYKKQKLDYDLEYGSDSVEIHIDAVTKGQRVVLIDDLLATGGTALAANQLLQSIGANVIGIGFVIELCFLSGRKKLSGGADVFSLIEY